MTTMDIKAGYYKARGVAGTEQFGYASGGGEQISLELDVQISDQETQRLTTILPFSGKAMQYSIERLKVLGWDGSNELRGIDRNEVDVEVKYEVNPQKPEAGPQLKVEVKTTGGRFAFRQPMGEPEKRGFMSKLAQEAKRLEAGAPPAQNGPPQGGRGYPQNWDTDAPRGKPAL